MSERFADLTKIPREPAARMMSMANAKLKSTLKAPPTAPVEVVLAELDGLGDDDSLIDMLRLLSVALPARERTWWACLAARDTLDGAEPPAPLVAAEAWVFKPSDDTRAAAQTALDTADTDDDTTLCAISVGYCDGMLGPGEMAEMPAPPGASETAAFGMNVKALGAGEDGPRETAQMLIDRALDIARGGDGRPKSKGDS